MLKTISHENLDDYRDTCLDFILHLGLFCSKMATIAKGSFSNLAAYRVVP